MRWLSDDNPDTTYYERVSETGWIEKRDGEEDNYEQVSADMDENGQYEVVLKRDDGLFVKLTDGKSSWSWIEDNINLPLESGRWEQKIRKYSSLEQNLIY